MLAVIGVSATHAEVFVRPAVWHVNFDDDGMATKTGGSLGIGAALGPGLAHEVGIDAATVAWKLERPSAPASPGAFLGVKGDGRLRPLLVGYRYRFGANGARFQPDAGGSLGVAKVSGELAFEGAGTSYAGPTDDWKTAWAGATGWKAGEICPKSESLRK